MGVNVTISNLNCYCVPLVEADFKDIAAIYIILCVNSDKSWTVIDVGQSGELGERINNHDRIDCWKRKCLNNNIWVCIYPMPTLKYTKENRLKLESELRSKYHNLCGKR
ncbi:MAG: hypothetical protein EPN82_05635 [Bacteroidetes bacterium]|nr:MAG: hypothetical protein EPN82_05635 [Bacteroidota bacterium]